MNYLIVEILGCLLIAGLIGAVLGWFLRGGCQKKLEHNSLDWQEKLRTDNLRAKNKISVIEDKFLHQLEDKDAQYKLKVNQIISNQKDKNSDLPKAKLTINQVNTNRINQENIFLKGELDRSVSELNYCEQENKNQEKSLNALNKKILILEEQLLLNNKGWKRKLQERELRWVDKVAQLDEASSSIKVDLKLFKQQVENSEITVLTIKKALDDCENKLKIKENSSPPQQKEVNKIKIDNLKVLRGIGVLVEKDLNKLGIFTLVQIASWSDNDVEQIDNELSFNGKIKREKWREQAQKIIAVL